MLQQYVSFEFFFETKGAHAIFATVRQKKQFSKSKKFKHT